MKYQLSPNVNMGFVDNVLLISTGADAPIVIKDKKEQEIIVDLCLEWQSEKTQEEIVTFLTQTLHLSIDQANEKFNQFLNWHFLIKAYAFDPHDRDSRNLLFYNQTEVDPMIVHERLRSKHVVIIGCGGIGNNIALHLVNARIGKITLIDNDVVEASNLTQQIMFTINDIQKKHKTEALAEALKSRSEQTQVETLSMFIDEETIKQVPACDLVIIAADSANIHADVNHHCHQTGTPFITANYLAQNAHFGPLVIPSKTACYRCFSHQYIFKPSGDNAQLQEKIDKIKVRGVDSSISPVVAIAGAFASLDIIKFLGEFGEVLSIERCFALNTKTLAWTDEVFQSMPGCVYCQV